MKTKQDSLAKTQDKDGISISVALQTLARLPQQDDKIAKVTAEEHVFVRGRIVRDEFHFIHMP